MRQRTSERVARAVIRGVIGFLVVLCLVPMVHLAAVSFSSYSAIIGSKVFLWPVEFTTTSYGVVFGDAAMISSLLFTIVLTVLYTAVAMLLTVCAAYALNKKRLKGRGFFLVLIVITMYFSGGLIPDYLLVKNLGLLNTMGGLVIPGALSAYYIIILKTFFADMPESIEESALLDGANDIQVLLRMVLPLSGPVLASISLFYAVDRWNRFYDALFYINSPALYPIQLKLYQIIINSTSLDISAVEGMAQNIIPDGLKAASVMFATVPILLVYPWLQKYFIKGVMIGAIKG